jgi:hypothetical protein
MSLLDSNQRILQLLSEADGPVTLGLLPLTAEEETAFINQVIEHCCGDVDRLMNLLRWKSPAVVTYAIAAAASQAVTEGKLFWQRFSDRIGIRLDSPNHRERLADAFKMACRRLGVVDPDVSAMTWKNIAPMMAQASILHAWADALARAMQSAMQRRPLPDLEDSRSLNQFAAELADHIHHQQNLRSILKTEVGGIVVHRLISSCVYDRFEILPAHLRGPMKKAFEIGGRQVSLKSPYVTFSVHLGCFEVVLPKQPGKLLSQATHWLVKGRQYSPQSDRTLDEYELGDRVCEVRLCRLAADYPDQEFKLDLSMVQPIRLFDESTLRERTVRIGEETVLAPGEYLVVLGQEAFSEFPEAEENSGDYRVLRSVTLRPGVDSLRIRHANQESCLSPALKAGIYHSAQEGLSTILEDGSRLHYGRKFELLVYIPKSQHSGFLRVAVASRNVDLAEEEVPLQQEEQGVYDYSSALEKSLQEAMEALPAGIHPIRVKVATDATAVTRDFWYWKGLQRISKHLGFYCDPVPSNVNFSRSKGIREAEHGCGLLEGNHAPRLVIALSQGESISIIRPGIRTVCFDPSEDDESEVRSIETLTVREKDSRVLEFESGGFEEWSLSCNGKTFANLDQKRTRQRIGLRSMIAEFGKSGVVDARSLSGDSFRLFGFASGLLGKRLELTLDHGQGLERWKTTMPCEGLGRLAIRVSDYSRAPNSEPGFVCDLAVDEFDAESGEKEVQVTAGIAVSYKLCPAEGNLHERLKLELRIEPATVDDRLLLVDLIHAPLGTEDWRSLECADGPNPSRLSVVTCGGAKPTPEQATWWHHLWRVNQAQLTDDAIRLYGNLGAPDVAAALAKISELTAIKYPSTVYGHSAKYLSSLAHKLSSRREAAGFRDSNTWWCEGASELEVHAAAKITPVVRQFLFSCNPHCLCHQWVSEPDREPRGMIESSFQLLGVVRRAGGRVAYAQEVFHSGKHPSEIFASFANSPQVFSGQAGTFSSFDFQRFFKPVFDRVLDHVESASPLDSMPLLSARHLLHATHALNRRARVLAKASDATADHPLHGALQCLASTRVKAASIIKNLNSKIGYVPWATQVNLDRHDHFDAPDAPELPYLASPQASALNEITWAFCVLGRATAHGVLPNGNYREHLKQFVGTHVQTHPINLILSFAPELFAYYVALLDFALYCPAPES